MRHAQAEADGPHPEAGHGRGRAEAEPPPARRGSMRIPVATRAPMREYTCAASRLYEAAVFQIILKVGQALVSLLPGSMISQPEFSVIRQPSNSFARKSPMLTTVGSMSRTKACRLAFSVPKFAATGRTRLVSSPSPYSFARWRSG